MRMPAISLHRTYLVARRDFLGYIRTWGFWISFLLPFVIAGLAVGASTLNIDLEPPRYEAILDETGEHEDAIRQRRQVLLEREDRALFENAQKAAIQLTGASRILEIYDNHGKEAAIQHMEAEYPMVASRIKWPNPSFILVDAPSRDPEDLKSYLDGVKTFDYQGRQVPLSGFLHIYKNGEDLDLNHWSTYINTEDEKAFYAGYFRNNSVVKYLESGGLTAEGLRDAQMPVYSISSFDPSKTAGTSGDSQKVTISDTIPYMVAGIMTVMLWLTIFSGSYMLLTSMLEEKLNKLLEMMLASTRLSEIIFGKLLGVAALTITAMLPYIILGLMTFAVVLTIGDPQMIEGLTSAFTPKMLIFFPIFLVLGYIFYGAFFIAMGTIANSMQDAQTLTTPIMLVLTMCFMVVPIGIMSPQAPILTIATYFPLSAPFAAIVRLPSDPSWMELIISALIVLMSALGVIWLAGRVFTYGVLSGAGLKGVRSWFTRVLLRRKPA